jgi:hypothetical protein
MSYFVRKEGGLAEARITYNPLTHIKELRNALRAIRRELNKIDVEKIPQVRDEVDAMYDIVEPILHEVDSQA